MYKLRYKLCPSRMKEEQFWKIYFLLGKEQKNCCAVIFWLNAVLNLVRNKLHWQDQALSTKGEEVVLSHDPKDVLAACRNDNERQYALATAEARALDAWRDLLPPPDLRLCSETYFDAFDETRWN
jgi:hypothetical protein